MAAKYNLAALARATKPGRRNRVIVFRPIVPTQALASDLYRAAYRPIIEALTEAVPRIAAAYGRGLPVRDGLIRDSTDEAARVIADIGDFLQRLVLTLAPQLNDWIVRVDTWHRGQFRGAALTATGIDLETMLIASGQPESVADAIAWNTALIRDVSDQARARIGNIVFSGFQARTPARDIAKQLAEAVGLSRQRALRIASDQTKKLSAALDRERAVDVGITSYEWAHSGKSHPRLYHLSRNGKVFRYDDPPLHDGRPDPPGAAPFCGCRARARLEL